MQKIVRQIAEEIRITEQQVKAAIELLDGGGHGGPGYLQGVGGLDEAAHLRDLGE